MHEERRAASRHLDGREQQRDEHRDDGNHHEQFNQSKTPRTNGTHAELLPSSDDQSHTDTAEGTDGQCNATGWAPAPALVEHQEERGELESATDRLPGARSARPDHRTGETPAPQPAQGSFHDPLSEPTPEPAFRSRPPAATRALVRTTPLLIMSPPYRLRHLTAEPQIHDRTSAISDRNRAERSRDRNSSHVRCQQITLTPR